MKYKIGDKVWIKPMDHSDLKGVVTGFQEVEPYDPIIDGIAYGNKFSNAFSLNRINHRKDGKVKSINTKII